MIPVPFGKKVLALSSKMPADRVDDYKKYVGQTFIEHASVSVHGVFEFIDSNGYRSGWLHNEWLERFVYEKRQPIVIIHDK